jgi:flavin-binding protein dodecin
MTGSVANIVEISARSSESFEDAIKVGIERASKTLRHVSGAWIKEQKVAIQEGTITGYEVMMEVTFVLE